MGTWAYFRYFFSFARESSIREAMFLHINIIFYVAKRSGFEARQNVTSSPNHTIALHVSGASELLSDSKFPGLSSEGCCAMNVVSLRNAAGGCVPGNKSDWHYCNAALQPQGHCNFSCQSLHSFDVAYLETKKYGDARALFSTHPPVPLPMPNRHAAIHEEAGLSSLFLFLYPLVARQVYA